MPAASSLSTNPAQAIRAIVDNLRSFWSLRSEPVPAGAEGIVWWTSGGVRRPLNGVLALEMADPGPSADRLAATFRLAGLPCAWMEGPDPRSPALGLRLLSLGYQALEGSQGWALPVDELAQSYRPVPGLLVRHGREPELVRAFGEIVADGALQLGAAERRPLELLLEPRERLGELREEVWLALRDGVPAAGVLTHARPDSVGLFGLTTAPAFRAGGIATALALAAAQGSAAPGVRWVVAESVVTHAGPLRRLGFRDYCDFRRYGWDPHAPVTPGR